MRRFDGESLISVPCEPAARQACRYASSAFALRSGPELQRELSRCGSQIPIIFITAHADAAVRRALLEQGAVECQFKPFSKTAVLDALHVALGTA